MAVLPIARIGEPVLREVAAPVPAEAIASPRVQTFIDDLVETMRDARGAGLAATQVFETLRICAVEVRANPRYPYKPDIPLTVLVNPQVEPVGDARYPSYEGCLSVPDLRGLVMRPERVRVRGADRDGRPLDFEATGFAAGTWQHEVDHLDGVLFVDRVEDSKSLCTWTTWEKHHKDAWLARVAHLQR